MKLRMNKILRKIEDIAILLTGWGIILAFTFGSVGAALWCIKWVLKLVGVM